MNTNLISTEYYSLAQLFGNDNRKIIIPDLQRDYCWGGRNVKDNKDELVSGFLDNILDLFYEYNQPIQKNENNEITLGLIYAYEHPSNHIQLCDGQQRLTTLYLLLGMVNKKSNGNFKKYLISKNDHKPYLQYAIRESTLYFLNDLVENFFLNNFNLKVDEINKMDWYFNEYNNDPSILSMLEALKIIENKMPKNNHVDFGIFLISKLKLLYYDMGNRKNGEETFVVINTTGEPLTATENIKPILIGKIKNIDKKNNYSKIWEDWEEFFWQNRNDGNDKEFTADDGLEEFQTWYLRIKTESDKPILKKDFVENDLLKIDEYFRKLFILLRYLTNVESKKIQEVFNTIRKFNIKDTKYALLYLRDFPITENEEQQNVILPLLHFMVKISSDEQDVYQFLRRLRKNYFDKFRKRKSNYVDWKKILQLIENSENLCKVLSSKEINSTWYNEEEIQKDLLKVELVNKLKIEEWEDNKDFMGDLSPLFDFLNFNGIPVKINYIAETYNLYCTLKSSKFIYLFRLINQIPSKRHGRGTRGKSFYQDLFYIAVPDKIVHTESWFISVFKCMYDNCVKGNKQVEDFLRNCIRDYLNFIEDKSKSIKTTEIFDFIKPIGSVDSLRPQFAWCKTISEFGEDEYYNRILLIVSLIHYWDDMNYQQYIGGVYYEDPTIKGRELNNIIGWYHNTSGSSYIDYALMPYFKDEKNRAEENIIDEMGKILVDI